MNRFLDQVRSTSAILPIAARERTSREVRVGPDAEVVSIAFLIPHRSTRLMFHHPNSISRPIEARRAGPPGRGGRAGYHKPAMWVKSPNHWILTPATRVHFAHFARSAFTILAKSCCD